LVVPSAAHLVVKWAGLKVAMTVVPTAAASVEHWAEPWAGPMVGLWADWTAAKRVATSAGEKAA
jgi:hypothetical protein